MNDAILRGKVAAIAEAIHFEEHDEIVTSADDSIDACKRLIQTKVDALMELIVVEVCKELQQLAELPNIMLPVRSDSHVRAIYRSAVTDRLTELKDGLAG